MGWHYAALEERFRRVAGIEGALAILNWDTAVVMPKKAAGERGDQLAALKRLSHDLLTHAETGEQLAGAEAETDLDAYQPDLRDEQVVPLFERLGRELPPLVEAILARQAEAPAPAIPAGLFPPARQKELGKELMARLGFDFDAGRLDESAHPFYGGTPADIRITTRYREDEVVSSLMGILHETGHALYEAGLPRAWAGQPVGEARGIAVHESQSLLFEMQACRSAAFTRFLAGELRAAFGDDPAFAPENLARIYTRVQRGFIRVDADEATYPLHVILRHRLERALIAGDLAVGALPGAWNEGMRDLLGVVPPDDRLGCLQDIHWPGGAFGYFPCYTLGAVLAAQLFGAAQAEVPGLLEAIGRGDFGPLLGWLREKVHGQGAKPSFADLVVHATGASLAAEPFLEHLRARYLGQPS